MSLPDDLANLARHLRCQTDMRKRRAYLRREMPRFYRHLQRVAVESDVLSRWGLSVNEDELAEQAIVDPKILEMIGDLVGVDLSHSPYHAGLQHTYGYLLSLIETPYGFKRDRWLTTTIEDGFALPAGSLRAFPPRGTLLGNLTVFLSMLSLRDQPPVHLQGSCSRFDLDVLRSIDGHRIVERIHVGAHVGPLIDHSEESHTRQSSLSDASRLACEIRTDLFAFLPPREHSDSLLVYSIRVGEAPAKLVTTFPIGRTTRTELLNEKRFGNERPVQLRFNAFVPGLPGKEAIGQRILQQNL